MSKNRYEGVDPFVLAIVRQQTRKLTQHSLFSANDYEDIEQELVMDYLISMETFDPARSDYRTYAVATIRRKVIDLIMHADASKRNPGTRVESIHELIFDDGETGGERIHEIANEDGLWGDAYLGWNHLSTEIKSDINRAIAKLPPPLAEICEALKTKTVSEIAREKGMLRQSIHYAIKKLRQHMKKAGLKIYL